MKFRSVATHRKELGIDCIHSEYGGFNLPRSLFDKVAKKYISKNFDEATAFTFYLSCIIYKKNKQIAETEKKFYNEIKQIIKAKPEDLFLDINGPFNPGDYGTFMVDFFSASLKRSSLTAHFIQSDGGKLCLYLEKYPLKILKKLNIPIGKQLTAIILFDEVKKVTSKITLLEVHTENAIYEIDSVKGTVSRHLK